MASPPSPVPTSPSDPPQALPLLTPPNPPSHPPSSSSSRRLPPPCWSHEETIALIDSYRDKWYSLRRGNLKANHWQDVADAVTGRCPAASPPKTAVQCRHKMEKLRKRYRTEIQRARSMPLARFVSSWVHFKRMDSMEKGPSEKLEDSYSPGEDENDDFDDEDQDLYGQMKNSAISITKSMRKLYGNGTTTASSGGGGGGGGGSQPFRIRIPSGVSIAHSGFNPNAGFSSAVSFGTRVLRESDSGRPGLAKKEEREREKEKDPVAEMVSAIRVLGDGFVKMEQMKMEMAREIETTRMEMEMKRTEMILESQHRIVEAFAKAVSEKKKKAKRMPSPET